MVGLHLYILFEAILFVIALSVDAFVASMTYGTDRIEIGWGCASIMSGVCSLLLVLAMFAGGLLGGILAEDAASWISFGVLFAIGSIKLFDGSIKAMLKKNKNLHREICFSAFHLRFILGIYANPLEADVDHSRTLSPVEAVALALSLSLDGIGAGVGAGIGKMNSGTVLVISFIMGVFAILAGCKIGRRLVEAGRWEMPWLGGVIMLLLAFLRLP